MRNEEELRVEHSKIWRRVNGLAGAAAVVGALAFAGCGSSSSSSSTTASSGGASGTASASTTASSSSSATDAVTAADVKTAAAFTHAKPGKAVSTETPIDIGITNNAAGVVTAPQFTEIAQILMNFANQRLGGIDGHPLKLVECVTGASDQQGQACGQQFRNNPQIKAVAETEVVGAQPFVDALAGSKPVFCAVPNPSDLNAKNTFCNTSGIFAAGAIAPYLKNYEHARTAVIISPDVPTYHAIAGEIQKQFDAAGVKTTLGFVSPTSPNVTSAVVASGASSAGGIFLIATSDGQCITLAKAFKTLATTKPVVSLPSCYSPGVKAGLGDVPKWTYFDVGESGLTPDPSPDATMFRDTIDSSGHPELLSQAFAPSLFGSLMFMIRTLNQAGLGASVAQISSIASKFNGPMFLGDPKSKFGSPPFPNFASARARFYTYVGGGKFENAAGGAWISALP